MAYVHRSQSGGDDVGVDKTCIEQRCDEVLVLLSQGAQLRDAQVSLVQAPSGVAGLAARRGRVGVPDLDEARAPAVR
jgi:hypothetical protein